MSNLIWNGRGKKIITIPEINYTATFMLAAGLTSSTIATALSKAESAWKTNGQLGRYDRTKSLDKVIYPLVGGVALSHSFNFVDPTISPLYYPSVMPTHTATGMAVNGANSSTASLRLPESSTTEINLTLYSRTDTLVADNNCVIDLATGKPFSIVSYGLNAEGKTWTEQMVATGKQLMFQGKYFKMLMDTKQVPITPMIIGFITDADDPSVNKFG